MVLFDSRAFATALIAVLGVSAAQAQFRPDYWEMVAEAERRWVEQARALEGESYEALLTERSARAHARMVEEGGYSAGLDGSVDWEAAHPNVYGAGTGHSTNYGYNYNLSPSGYTLWNAPSVDFPIWLDVAPDDEPIESLFSEYISEQIVQGKCVICHKEGGASGVGISRLQFHPAMAEDRVNLNRQVFTDLIAVLEAEEDIEDPVQYVLNKVSGGVTHIGGALVTSGTADFANLERFLRLLAEESGSTAPGLTPETFFEGVTMASPARTLRRAAILFAGRLPTQAELDAVADGEEDSLRTAIQGLMEGDGFHDFLVRASNDRLLTDRHFGDPVISPSSREFVALNGKQVQMVSAARSRGYDNPWDDRTYLQWTEALTRGTVRAPLELIAYVVENDLPYTEILTGDYIMANPMAAEAYGDTITSFDDANDLFEFKPTEFASYYRNDDSKIIDQDETLDIDVIQSPGNLLVEDYPHAGILNTTVFLARYPSTATNRNRARSRWTYYHFLGHDIEKSNPRPLDPETLADTNNPTLNNPACVACHRNLDPVAGAFQNYGDEGLYRDQWGGKDSLPRLYKSPEDGSTSPYRDGDTWYRDMRNPGFGDLEAPDASNSVQWLAQQIVADDRFAEAAVKFWWVPIMGVDLAAQPSSEDTGAPDYQARSVTASAQAAEIGRLAAAFRSGIAGGEPYNGKDLLTETALSPWFRAESVTDEDPVRSTALRDAGVARLLTPEELDRKTEAVSGYKWGRFFYQTMNPERGEERSFLVGGRNYELLYGGIDSDGITIRAADMTPVMAAVAQAHAAEVSCPIVRREFFFWDDDERLLFDGISRFDTPVSETYDVFEVTAETWETRQTFSVNVPLTAGGKTIRLSFGNDFSDGENELDRNLNVDRIEIRDRDSATIQRFELEDLGSGCGHPQGFFDSFYTFSGEGCWLEVPVEVFEDGTYQIDIVAHQDPAGDEAAQMTVAVDSNDGISAGSTAIRDKLVDLHQRILGVDAAPDSTDVDEAFQLFFDVWALKRRTEGSSFGDSRFECMHAGDASYYDGLIENPVVGYDRNGNSILNWDQIDELYGNTETDDPEHVVRAWVVTLAYLMTDYRYLYFF